MPILRVVVIVVVLVVEVVVLLIIVMSALVVVLVAWAEDHPGHQWLIVSANYCAPLPLQYAHSESISEHIATVPCLNNPYSPHCIVSLFELHGLSTTIAARRRIAGAV